MANKNAIMEAPKFDRTDLVDFDELEAKLENDLDAQFSELEFLKEEHGKIGNPESLGGTVMNVVWEQFLNQIASTAGDDFIRENNGLKLDLSNDAHIQTTENFANGKIASHNTKINYQKRYDEWQDNFQKNEDGTIKMRRDNRSNTDKAVLKKNARESFDENRDKGSAAVHKDHTKPVADIIRDPAANAHLDKQEQIDWANSDVNLKDLDAAANMAKRDSTMSEWLDSERDGEKPADRFNIDENELREREKIADEDYNKTINKGKQKSIETGKQSRKEEAFKISGKALRAVIMQLLAELIKTVIGNLIKWFKSKKRNIKTLLDSIKSAIISFVKNLKKHLINAGRTLITTIATAIFGPIARTINKVFILLQQGWRSLKEAIDYLKNPVNKNKSSSTLVLEVGKIVMAGLSAVGAIALGELIEKGLMAIPGAGAVFAFEIPILGSLASILGLFLGGLIAGIIGAIAMSLIDKMIAKKLTSEAKIKEIDKSNEILNKQKELIYAREGRLTKTKNSVSNSISERHKEAGNTIKDALSNIFDESPSSETVISDNEEEFNEMYNMLSELRN